MHNVKQLQPGLTNSGEPHKQARRVHDEQCVQYSHEMPFELQEAIGRFNPERLGIDPNGYLFLCRKRQNVPSIAVETASQTYASRESVLNSCAAQDDLIG